MVTLYSHKNGLIRIFGLEHLVQILKNNKELKTADNWNDFSNSFREGRVLPTISKKANKNNANLRNWTRNAVKLLLLNHNGYINWQNRIRPSWWPEDVPFISPSNSNLIFKNF